MRNLRKQKQAYFIFIASIILLFPTMIVAKSTYEERLFSKSVNDDICYVIKKGSAQDLIDEVSRHRIEAQLTDVLSSLQCKIRLPDNSIIRRSVLRMVVVESGAPGTKIKSLLVKTRSLTFEGSAWLDSQLYSRVDNVTLFEEIRRAYNHREDFPGNQRELLTTFRVLCTVLKKIGRLDLDANITKECEDFGLKYKSGGKIPDQI